MRHASYQTVIVRFIALLLLTVAFSYLASKAWGEKKEAMPDIERLTITDTMTVADFITANSLPLSVFAEAFGRESSLDLQQNITTVAPSFQELKAKISRATALHHEEKSKNWIKIPLKFGLWLLFLTLAFSLLRRGRLNTVNRKYLYLAALIIFGVILGADPSPMGTIKDAIALYGAQGVIFKPRLVALAVFLALTLIANKFICGWGCQLGVLQDLIFRLNRKGSGNSGIMPQYKPPFWLTNTIRLIFFLVFTSIALLWATDIIAFIDPFKIFNPNRLSIAGWLLLASLLTASLFIYRPWCHLFCPFGLAGWLAENLSLFNIKVNQESCTQCKACATACPSTAMTAILRDDRLKPDCFACGSCIGSCPSKSLSFSFTAGRKQL